jgi:hypothetical protein
MAQRTPARTLAIEHLEIATVKSNPRNVRKHSAKQIRKLCRNVSAYGITNPLVVDEERVLLAGHGRLEALRHLKWETAPCVVLTGLSEEQKTAFAIADNKLGDESEFDEKGLNALLKELAGVGFDMELTGFDMGEIDFRIDGAACGMLGDPDDDFEQDVALTAVTRPGDLWRLGDHCILCGSALDAATFRAVLGERLAQVVFTDPPYNVPVQGHVSGLGKVQHREFAMASGEMSEAEFAGFLATSLQNAADHSADGSIHFVCMDWRHIQTLLEVGGGVYDELKNLCVWSKANAGMGSLYRSQHELVAVFKRGKAPHRNNVELGKHGRYRSNVWEYAGANSFSATRSDDLAAHPTVKPVALVADALRDVTKRGDLALDLFLGSGTTVLAAERCGRVAAGIELDPLYVDTAIRRWQRLTGKAATLDGDGRTFDDIGAERALSEEAA